MRTHDIGMSQRAKCVVSSSILPDIYFTCREARHKIYPVSLQ
jgi:hypothetical protein